MAANTLNLNTSNPVSGIGTQSFNIVNAGQYTVEVKSTLPLGSNLSITINKNGSAVVPTSGGLTTDPTPTQQSIGASANFQCAAADLVQVVFASSNAVDSLPDAVKSIVNFYQTS